jgi:hypothetical protein
VTCGASGENALLRVGRKALAGSVTRALCVASSNATVAPIPASSRR